MSDIQEQIKLAHKKAEENDRYLRCETITGEWWYKDMKTGEDLPLYSTPIKGLENDIKLLQEELEEEKRIEKESLKTIQNLEEENKKLKELCDKYEEEHNTKFNEWVFDKRENERLKIEYQRLANDDAWEIADYKSRNEKAIEELELWKPKDKVIKMEIDYLLNILQGKEK